jgi:uncharacterized membrane protein
VTEEPESPAPRRGLAWGPSQIPQPREQPARPGLQHDHGYYQILVRSLIRAQLGLSLVCLAFALAVTISFPILYAGLPWLSHTTIAGLPVTLVALGAGVYPVILAIGWFYTFQSNRLESRFVGIMAHSDQDEAEPDD